MKALATAYRSAGSALGVCFPIAAVIACAVGFGAWSASAGLMVFVAMTMYALAIGSVLVLVYGAPVYALLLRLGLASYPTAAAAGLLPGAVVCASLGLFPFGFWILVFGLCLALATHRMARMRQSVCGASGN